MQSIKPPKQQKETRALANHELVVVAAFLVGAQNEPADTEDIAVKANELAPGRFAWRKYKDQINIEAVRKRLWDAAKLEKGGLLIGSEKTGWRLTKAGFVLANRHITAGAVSGKKTRVSQNESAARTREIKRMLNDDAVKKFHSGERASIAKSDAERFFRIDDYVTGKSRSAKIERFRIMVTNNRELTETIDFLAHFLTEK